MESSIYVGNITDLVLLESYPISSVSTSTSLSGIVNVHIILKTNFSFLEKELKNLENQAVILDLSSIFIDYSSLIIRKYWTMIHIACSKPPVKTVGDLRRHYDIISDTEIHRETTYTMNLLNEHATYACMISKNKVKVFIVPNERSSNNDLIYKNDNYYDNEGNILIPKGVDTIKGWPGTLSMHLDKEEDAFGEFETAVHLKKSADKHQHKMFLSTVDSR